jgi:murein DD-endopeptidase MepM/ murein hydrolase activator NlpD
MEVIVITSLQSKIRRYRLGWPHVIVFICGVIAFSVILVSLLLNAAFSLGNTYEIPVVTPLLRHLEAKTEDRLKDYTQRNLRYLAQEVGTLKAEIQQVKDKGERVSKLLYLPIQNPPTPYNSSSAGLGGPLLLYAGEPQNSQYKQMVGEINYVRQTLNQQRDLLETSEALLTDKRLRNPQWDFEALKPVVNASLSSPFGWRSDPFTGQRALHSGLDFNGPIGTPILSAAEGIVLSTQNHPSYGLVVEIDHGNKIHTRYAHTSKILVKPGDYVKRGQAIALIGNTGRSTGAHLHFEVLVDGIHQNPAIFLADTDH